MGNNIPDTSEVGHTTTTNQATATLATMQAMGSDPEKEQQQEEQVPSDDETEMVMSPVQANKDNDKSDDNYDDELFVNNNDNGPQQQGAVKEKVQYGEDAMTNDKEAADAAANGTTKDPTDRKEAMADIALGVGIRSSGKDPNKKKRRPKKILAKKTVKKMEAMKKEAAAAKRKKAKHESSADGAAVKVERTPNEMIYEGAPRKDLPGGWPEGWIERKFQRTHGTSARLADSYFYPPPPHEKRKLRSIKEVQRYLFAMKASSGDEAFAWSQRAKGPTE